MKNRKIPVVAIDTNRINLRKKLYCMNELEEWHDTGKIRLVLPGSTVGELRDYSSRAIEKASCYNKVLSPARYGNGLTYGNILYGSPEPEYSAIKKILFGDKVGLSRNEILDIYHLIACLRNKVDYFITDDAKHILSKRKELFNELNICVCNSDDLVKILKKLYRDVLPE